MRHYHGKSHSPEYVAYQQAKSRCTNRSHAAYSRYGGRGIEFRFTSFAEWFRELGLRPSPSHSVDRKDNNGPYAPGNVRWATPHQQQCNRRRRAWKIDPRIPKLYAQGIGTPTIGKVFGVGKECIRKRLVRAGIPRRPRRKSQ